jgi:hypothetical protein
MLAYIRGTTTVAGLSVNAVLDEGTYRKGLKVTAEDEKKLRIEHHEVNPQWNYTIRPRATSA